MTFGNIFKKAFYEAKVTQEEHLCIIEEFKQEGSHNLAIKYMISVNDPTILDKEYILAQNGLKSARKWAIYIYADKIKKSFDRNGEFIVSSTVQKDRIPQLEYPSNLGGIPTLLECRQILHNISTGWYLNWFLKIIENIFTVLVYQGGFEIFYNYKQIIKQHIAFEKLMVDYIHTYAQSRIIPPPQGQLILKILFHELYYQKPKIIDLTKQYHRYMRPHVVVNLMVVCGHKNLEETILFLDHPEINLYSVLCDMYNLFTTEFLGHQYYMVDLSLISILQVFIWGSNRNNGYISLRNSIYDYNMVSRPLCDRLIYLLHHNVANIDSYTNYIKKIQVANF